MKDNIKDLEHGLWHNMGDINAGMLHTDAERILPMSHYTDRENRCLWFITAEGTDAHQAAQAGRETHYVVADGKTGLYARLSGRLEVSNDSDKLDSLWSPVAAAWFENGREDEDVRLLKFTLTKAEIWLTEGSAGFIFDIAKANITGEEPDVGSHGTVTF